VADTDCLDGTWRLRAQDREDVAELVTAAKEERTTVVTTKVGEVKDVAPDPRLQVGGGDMAG
jgi:hypothetical protein